MRPVWKNPGGPVLKGVAAWIPEAEGPVRVTVPCPRCGLRADFRRDAYRIRMRPDEHGDCRCFCKESSPEVLDRRELFEHLLAPRYQLHVTGSSREIGLEVLFDAEEPVRRERVTVPVSWLEGVFASSAAARALGLSSKPHVVPEQFARFKDDVEAALRAVLDAEAVAEVMQS